MFANDVWWVMTAICWVAASERFMANPSSNVLNSDMPAIPFSIALLNTSSTAVNDTAALSATLARLISPFTAANSFDTTPLGSSVSSLRLKYAALRASIIWNAASELRFRASAASVASCAACASAFLDVASRWDFSPWVLSVRASRAAFSCFRVEMAVRNSETYLWKSSSRRRCIRMASSKFPTRASLPSKSLMTILSSSACTSSISVAISALSSSSRMVRSRLAFVSSKFHTLSDSSVIVSSSADV
mmetsp:Transcript_38258/g.92285  ORF Transcript_38258/g.92285 Transcript_38258/m.92285 type:complete len:247 (-) Transcript_38258:1055-1795(-)